MKAYKGTRNGKCRTITYEVGKTYTFEGEIQMCERGFHFCKEMKHVFSYYKFNKDFVMLEIEILGEVIDEDDKSVTDKFKVLSIVSPKEYEHICFIEYDKSGNMIHSKDSSDFEEWHEYDKKGNEIHYKDSDGYEEWYEYDESGNMIHYKDDSGSEKWREYDEKGNMINSKSSNGYEEWHEYDESGNMIHSKDSYGFEKWYEYDKKGNMIHYKDSDDGTVWKINIQ